VFVDTAVDDASARLHKGHPRHARLHVQNPELHKGRFGSYLIKEVITGAQERGVVPCTTE
jgi:hypothetical protein